MDFNFGDPSLTPSAAATGLSPFRKQLGELFDICWKNWGCDRDEAAMLVARRYFIEGGQTGHRLAAEIVKQSVCSLSELSHVGQQSAHALALSHLGERIANTLCVHANDQKTAEILSDRFLEIWHAGAIPERRREIIPRRQLAQLFYSTGGRTGMEASAAIIHQLLIQVVQKTPGNANAFLMQLTEALPRTIIDSI